jgi:hypothetical protein
MSLILAGFMTYIDRVGQQDQELAEQPIFGLLSQAGA